MVLVIEKLGNVGKIALLFGTFLLMVLALMYTKDRFWSIAQFLEYSLQFGSPLFLLWGINTERLSHSSISIIKWAIAATFVSHGLYAINFYPRPALFLSMTISILEVSEAKAIFFLQVAGVADFLAAGLLFLNKPFRQVGTDLLHRMGVLNRIG